MTHIQPQYLLFTSLVKHGELLRYLLAAQVRKRLMEPYGIHRQVKSSAVTGNPDRLFEIYYVDEPDRLIKHLEELSMNQTFRESHRLIEDARIHSLITENERDTKNERDTPYELSPPSKYISLLDGPPPLQKLTQMDYLLETKSRQECAQSIAEAPYLLQVTCTLYSSDMLLRFSDCMKYLLDIFANSGLTLLIAGQHASTIKLAPATEKPVVETGLTSQVPITILNVWQFEDPDSPKLLMSQLAENPTYSELDTLCTQDQHICRNVSRHYQRYPLLPGVPVTM